MQKSLSKKETFRVLDSFFEIWQRIGIYFALILVVIGLSLLSDRFLTQANIIQLLNHVAVIAIVCIGQTFVIAGRGIDLSVGSVVALTGSIMAWFALDFNMHPVLVIVIGVLMSTTIGALHGYIISRFKIPDLIVTLAGLEIWRGLVYLLFEARVLRGLPELLRFAGHERIGWLPVSILFLFGLTILAAIVMRYSTWGRYILAIGGNPKAAAYCGIDINKYKILSYAISGFCCGIAAWMLIGRLNAAQSSLAIGYELHSIAAVVIGGTSLFGGTATIAGSVGGALLIALVRNGLVLGGFNFYWYMIILGILLVLAVGITVWQKRRNYL